MLAPLVYVDLVGKPEAEAETLLLGALQERGKPDTRPSFPQAVPQPERVTADAVAFPGTTLSLPFPRNPFFTGREDQLAAIHTALTSRGRAALSRLGGIGKTQTAMEYVYRHQSEYEQVFWLRAEQETELVTRQSNYHLSSRALSPVKPSEIGSCHCFGAGFVPSMVKQQVF